MKRSRRAAPAALLILLLYPGIGLPAWPQEEEPTAGDSVATARELLAEGHYEEAISHYRTALDSTPDDPNLWVELGEAYRSELRMTEAIASFRKTLELQPDHELAQLSLAESTTSTRPGAFWRPPSRPTRTARRRHSPWAGC